VSIESSSIVASLGRYQKLIDLQSIPESLLLSI